MSDQAGRVSVRELPDSEPRRAVDWKREWPEAVKRQIVAETEMPGASVLEVARRHNVHANQVSNWRRQYRVGLPDGDAELGLVPVSLRPLPAAAGGTIEIELTSGARVRISGAVDGAALHQVLEHLK
jgi:transposase